MTALPDAHAGRTRAAGALLAAIAGETWRGTRPGPTVTGAAPRTGEPRGEAAGGESAPSEPEPPGSDAEPSPGEPGDTGEPADGGAAARDADDGGDADDPSGEDGQDGRAGGEDHAAGAEAGEAAPADGGDGEPAGTNSTTPFADAGPVTEALLDLARSYVADGSGAPVEVAARHGTVPAPGWLLPVAIARPYNRTRSGDALRLARAAGVAGHALASCVSYVALAAELFAGRPADDAVRAVTGEPAPRSAPSPVLCGEPHLDALAASVWALAQRGGLEDIVAALAGVAPPAVRAAACALLGLRDGVDAVPEAWRGAIPEAGTCFELADALLRVRRRAFLEARPGQAGGRRGLGGATAVLAMAGAAAVWTWPLPG